MFAGLGKRAREIVAAVAVGTPPTEEDARRAEELAAQRRGVVRPPREPEADVPVLPLRPTQGTTE